MTAIALVAISLATDVTADRKLMQRRHRERMLRKRAATIGLQVRRSGPLYELHNADGPTLTGTLDTAETYVEARYVRRRPGPQLWAHCV